MIAEEYIAIAGSQAALITGVAIGSFELRIHKPNTTTFITWTLQLAIIALLIWEISPQTYAKFAPSYKYNNIVLPHQSATISWMLFNTCIGILTGTTLTRAFFQKRKHTKWLASQMQSSKASRIIEKHFILLILLCLATTAAYIQFIGGPKKVPLFMMLNGASYMDIVIAREESFKFLPAPARYIFHTLRSFILPALTTYSYIIYRSNGNSKKHLIRFIATFGTALLYNASSSALGPALWLFVYLALFELVNPKVSTTKKLSTGFVFFLGLLAAHHALISLTSGIHVNFFEASWEVVNERVLQKGINVLENASVFIHTFPEPLGISGYAKFAPSFGSEAVNINNVLYLNFNPKAVVLSGTYNGAWFHYDLINWGLPGVFLGSIACGALLTTLDTTIRSFSKTPLSITLYCFTIVATLGLFDKALHTWVISHGGILGTLTLIALNLKINLKNNVDEHAE